MLGSSTPAAATLSTTTSSATPTSPVRSGRLRGLSYLRSYTHNHLHSHSQSPSGQSRNGAPPLSRSATSPSLQTSPRHNRAQSLPQSQENVAPSPQRTNTESGDNITSGWVPAVGGRSGLSRVAPQPQPTSPDSSLAEPPATATMTRSRAATVVNGSAVDITSTSMRNQGTTDSGTPGASAQEGSADAGADAGADSGAERKEQLPSIRFIPHQDTRATRPSLNFPIVNRTLASQSTVVRMGRYSERDTNAADALTNPLSTAPVGFKSKVVSRRHCEFWYSNNQWYIKDVKSSSGTFLNHVRLSSPGMESRPYPVNDGDVVQLGIDFKGGEEVIFRCVKIRLEVNRGWQKSLNSFK